MATPPGGSTSHSSTSAKRSLVTASSGIFSLICGYIRPHPLALPMRDHRNDQPTDGRCTEDTERQYYEHPDETHPKALHTAAHTSAADTSDADLLLRRQPQDPRMKRPNRP